jgi:hypothetical protein
LAGFAQSGYTLISTVHELWVVKLADLAAPAGSTRRLQIECSWGVTMAGAGIIREGQVTGHAGGLIAGRRALTGWERKKAHTEARVEQRRYCNLAAVLARSCVRPCITCGPVGVDK